MIHLTQLLFIRESHWQDSQIIDLPARIIRLVPPRMLAGPIISSNKITPGTSLVVQWLRIRLPMQGTRVRSLVRELRSHMLRGN